MFWGITSALDLLAEYKESNNKITTPSELNILLVGGGDARHILKTLARRYRHEVVTLNFYVIEACMETVARQLLLLLTALQPRDSLGLDQKTKIFMELYGNTLIRPYTSKYLTNVANDMVKMITNYEYLKQKMEFVIMDLKYKERDYLETLFKFWCGRDEFQIVDIWDRRLRKILGVRYDSKMGAFDWDLHMRMHLVGGKQVCDQEYRNFRQNGVAFSWLECEVSRPNRSLVCALMPNGERFVHYGYLGDMETGPFVAFGMECEDETYLKRTNGRNSFRATDVTERNLKQIFYEIENDKEYIHTKKNDMELGCATIKQSTIIVDTKASEVSLKEIKSCLKIDNLSIRFTSISVLDQMKYKEQYRDVFDLIYFSSNHMKYFDNNTVGKIAKEESLLLIENQLFVLSNRKKDLEEYAKKVDIHIGEMNVEKIDFDMEVDHYFKYIVRNKNK